MICASIILLTRHLIFESLPNHVVLSDTVKSRLDKFWQHQHIIYYLN